MHLLTGINYSVTSLGYPTCGDLRQNGATIPKTCPADILEGGSLLGSPTQQNLKLKEQGKEW
jgi:hypothetical protein